MKNEKNNNKEKEEKGEEKGMEIEGEGEATVSRRPFLYLSLSLPPVPLFKSLSSDPSSSSSSSSSYLPLLPLSSLLSKFNGTTVDLNYSTLTARSYRLLHLPSYLLIHYQRFTRSSFGGGMEKNNTLIQFPLEQLDMKEYYYGENKEWKQEEMEKESIEELKEKAKKMGIENGGEGKEKKELIQLLLPRTTYNLIANVVHDEGKEREGEKLEGGEGGRRKGGGGGGAAGEKKQEERGGSYRIHRLYSPTGQWYELKDLRVWTTDPTTMPGLVALSEPYIQVYERQK